MDQHQSEPEGRKRSPVLSSIPVPHRPQSSCGGRRPGSEWRPTAPHGFAFLLLITRTEYMHRTKRAAFDRSAATVGMKVLCAREASPRPNIPALPHFYEKSQRRFGACVAEASKVQASLDGTILHLARLNLSRTVPALMTLTAHDTGPPLRDTPPPASLTTSATYLCATACVG
jgi:hypothetical protein